jgi:hypothetical protein
MGGNRTIDSANLCEEVTVRGQSIHATLTKLPWAISGPDIRIVFLESVFAVDRHGTIVSGEGTPTLSTSAGLGTVDLATGTVNFTPPQAEGLAGIGGERFRVHLNLKMHYKHAFAVTELRGDRVTILNPHGKDHLYLEMSDLPKYFNQLQVSRMATL